MLRGWPALAEQVEGVGEAHHAAWVGTLSYGVNGLLQAQGGLRLPALQLNERDRYLGLTPPVPLDLAKPGLIVDLPRRIDLARLRGLFHRGGRAGGDRARPAPRGGRPLRRRAGGRGAARGPDDAEAAEISLGNLALTIPQG